MLIFLDAEFTGLHQHTTLISIGLVAENGEQFYAELTDYDVAQVNDWVRDNVIAHLWNGVDVPPHVMYLQGTKLEVAEAIGIWLYNLGSPHYRMVGDVLAYDWVLFCDLFGGSLNLPKGVNYIPIDLATLLFMEGYNPDVKREEFAEIWTQDNKHNALFDANVLRSCYEKLVRQRREG